MDYLDDIEIVMVFISISELAFDVKPSVRKESLHIMHDLLEKYSESTFKLNTIFTIDELELHIEASQKYDVIKSRI
jgi:hypothetical protein